MYLIHTKKHGQRSRKGLSEDAYFAYFEQVWTVLNKGHERNKDILGLNERNSLKYREKRHK